METDDKKKKIHIYNMNDVYFTYRIFKQIQVPWWKRLWYRIRFGSALNMKKNNNETPLEFGTRFHKELEKHFNKDKK